MRLISKYHDYYDSAIGYGIDPNVTYVRKAETFKVRTPEYKQHIDKLGIKDFIHARHTIKRGDMNIKSFMLIFCGKAYYGIRFEYIRNGTAREHLPVIYGVFYDFDSAEFWFNKWGLDIESTLEKKRELWYNSASVKIIKEHFNKVHEHQKFIDYTFELDAPAIYIGPDYITTNPRLVALEFYKAKAPFEAFQELSMYISGVMGGSSPKLVELTDKDLIAKHGFDKKSFRKEKEIYRKARQ